MALRTLGITAQQQQQMAAAPLLLQGGVEGVQGDTDL
jgi:hypothetical protein